MPMLTHQQERAVQSQAGRILVSAGAGSGKTHVLVERYVERLRHNPELNVQNLIAVTFTRKAANEMRLRLKARFRSLMEAASADERERWSKCASEVDGARIGTIHSLCEAIIRAFPLAAGVDPQLEVLDELEAAKLIEESIDVAFRSVVDSSNNERDLLLHFDIVSVRHWLGQCLRGSLQFKEAIAGIAGMSLEEFISFAHASVLQRKCTSIKRVASSGRLERVLSLLDSIELPAGNNLLPFVADVKGHIDTLISSDTSTVSSPQVEKCWRALQALAQVKPKNTGGNGDEARSARAAIKSAREVSQDITDKLPDLNDSDETAFSFCFKFLNLANSALKAYEEMKREQMRADYNDLISLALQALEPARSDARDYYNNTIAEILVDEFQDTNRMQTRLIELLAGPGTGLFLIGDDKQSIYKFQGADISTFNECRRRLSQTDGDLLSLSKSFRSHPGVVAFINVFFKELMDDGGEDSSYAAQFEPLEAARSAGESENRRVEVVYFDGADTGSAGRGRAESARMIEARAVVNWIKTKTAGGTGISTKDGGTRSLSYGDIAILVQRNRDFAWIEDALMRSGIPYVMLGGRSFLERQEVFDLENLLAFLAEPLNDHGLLVALRSPMFAVGDDLLTAIGLGKTSGTSLWQAINMASRQRKPGQESVKRAVLQLRALQADAHCLALPQLVRKIIERTKYDIALLSLPNGKQRSRNLWKLVAMAEERQHMSCAEFAQTLSMMREYNIQQTDAPLNSEGAVKLMTVHGSKGLEFPAVLLPVLDASARGMPDRLIFHRDFGLALNTARSDGEIKPAWYTAACAMKEEMEIAERKRLFYVAATRARDYLAMFLDNDGRSIPSFRLWLHEWLQRNSPDGAMGTSSTDNCSIDFYHDDAENPDQQYSCAPFAPLTPSIKSWDLIWDAHEDAPSAPPANSGSRITVSSTRLHLESTVVGTFFHALLEQISTDFSPPSDDVLMSLAFAQSESVADRAFFEQLIEEGRHLMNVFFASDFCCNLKMAKRHYHEIPYQLCKNGGVTKRPDLIYQDQQDRWHLIDYKTDHVSLSEIPAHVDRHRKQVLEYVSEIESLTGIRCIPAIYFAQHGIVLPLPI